MAANMMDMVFGTANCNRGSVKKTSATKKTKGSKKQPPKNGLGKGASPKASSKAAVRAALLQPCLSDCDVCFLQEMKCKTDLKKAMQDTHLMYTPGYEAGILLKKGVFEEVKFKTGADFRKFTDEVNYKFRNEDVLLETGRYVFAVANKIGSDESFLFVCYHGPHRFKKSMGKKDGQPYSKEILVCRIFLDLCRMVKVEVGATYIVIGGDFNLPAEVASDHVLKDCPKYDITFTGPSPRRAGKRVLDFFLHSCGVSVGDVQVHIFYAALRKKYDVEDDTELEELFLDHDPVVMNVVVNVVNADEKEEQKESSHQMGKKEEEGKVENASSTVGENKGKKKKVPTATLR